MAVGVLDILRKSLLLSSKNISFIIFTIISSLPLFFFLVYYDFPLQKFLLETIEILREDPGDLQFDKLMRCFLHELTQLGIYYLVPLHLLELCMVLVIVDLASKIYRGDRVPLTLKDMVNKPIDMAKLRGTLITFLYVTFLSSCTLLGLLWLLTTGYAFSSSFISSVFIYRGDRVPLTLKDMENKPIDMAKPRGTLITFLYVTFLSSCALLGLLWLLTTGYAFSSSFISSVFNAAVFIVPLTLYLAASAVWNTSVVVSILEGIYGTEALALSSYYSRGSNRCGLILMLFFFACEVGLRLPCLYIGCYQRGSGIVAQSSFFCLGTALKWVVFVVYFHNCKERTLEKKVDAEAGTEVRVVVDK